MQVLQEFIKSVCSFQTVRSYQLRLYQPFLYCALLALNVWIFVLLGCIQHHAEGRLLLHGLLKKRILNWISHSVYGSSERLAHTSTAAVSRLLKYLWEWAVVGGHHVAWVHCLIPYWCFLVIKLKFCKLRIKLDLHSARGRSAIYIQFRFSQTANGLLGNLNWVCNRLLCWDVLCALSVGRYQLLRCLGNRTSATQFFRRGSSWQMIVIDWYALSFTWLRP